MNYELFLCEFISELICQSIEMSLSTNLDFLSGAFAAMLSQGPTLFHRSELLEALEVLTWDLSTPGACIYQSCFILSILQQHDPQTLETQ